MKKNFGPPIQTAAANTMNIGGTNFFFHLRTHVSWGKLFSFIA